MVADRAGTSGSCQALLMMMRVASPVGRRIGDGGGQMQHAGFEQVGFHFVPVDLDTRRKAPPALFFWLRSIGIFRSLPSGKLVSQTSRLGIRPALPTVQTRGAHPQRSRQTTPLHSTSNAGSVPKRWLAPVLPGPLFAAVVWPGSSLSFGSITLSLRHCCRWLQPDILPWLPCKAHPPPGWSVA